jgi:hypothetical protein
MVAAVALVLWLSTIAAGAALAAGAPQSVIVNPDPVDWTPNVLDGAVQAFAQVGTRVIAGGTFSQVQNASGGSVLNRHFVFAFDAATGAVDTGFAPSLDGQVTSLAAAPDGTSVFVGGSFSTVNGVSTKGLVELNASTGATVGAFSAKTNAEVMTLAVHGDRLYVGGEFTTIRGVSRSALASVDTTTGAVDPNMSLAVTGSHRGVGATSVVGLDVTPDGARLIVTGNFNAVGGVTRVQAAMIDLSTVPATVANWETDDFVPTCSTGFFTYMRAVDVAPDGTYFVIVTTGGGKWPNSLCDSTSRWETGATGTHIHPTWVDYTGGDTLLSVETTGTAVYVGGHQRWENNARVANKPAMGAVERPGIAALDPRSGIPFRWNPTKDRGVGTSALLATAAGLLIGSDTTQLGHEYHARLGMFPVGGGEEPPDSRAPTLPGDLYLAKEANSLTRQTFDGSALGAPSALSTPGVDWSQARGTFSVAGTGLIYAAWSDGTIYSFTFDGQSLGPPVDIVSAAHYVIGDWISFAGMSGFFYDSGRLYYTRSGNKHMYYRLFSPESGVIGSIQYTVSGGGDGLNWRWEKGMTEAGGHIYYATANGNLHRIDFAGGVPVPGTDQVISGPNIDGRNWVSNGLFIVGQ